MQKKKHSNAVVKPNQEGEVYQLRLILRGVSPLFWRRFLIKSDSTIADLHFYIQIMVGWSDTYLHHFIIHGKSYGITHAGGMSFSDNPKKVYLKDFQFRPKERFIYEYNFFDNWQYEIRVEQRLSMDAKKTYPLCIGGGRAAPIEDCGGTEAFMALQEEHSPWRIEKHLLECIEAYQAGEENILYVQDTLQALRYWVNQDQFHCGTVNHLLRRYTQGEDIHQLLLEGANDEN